MIVIFVLVMCSLIMLAGYMRSIHPDILSFAHADLHSLSLCSFFVHVFSTVFKTLSTAVLFSNIAVYPTLCA